MASDDIPTQAGQTVLHLAAQAGHVDTVAALLDRGCDSNVLDSVSSEREERWESDLLPSTGGQEFPAAGSSRRSPGDCQAPAQCRGRRGPPGRAGQEHSAPPRLRARLQPGSLPPLLQQGKCLHEEQGRLRSSACGLSERSQPIMSGTSHQRLPAWHQEQRETRTQEENFGHLCWLFQFGDTPLHTSARYGHAGVTRILISAKCKVSQQNKNGDTALHIAAAMGKRKLTRILVQAGVNINVRNNQGETAMEIAFRKDLPFNSNQSLFVSTEKYIFVYNKAWDWYWGNFLLESINWRLSTSLTQHLLPSRGHSLMLQLRI